MSCHFCFATFRDVRETVLPAGHLSAEDAERIVIDLARAGFKKITFAGGEPLLCPWLGELIRTARAAGVTTSLVTNGSLLNRSLMEDFRGVLDWVTISIDSLRASTLQATGRTTRGRAMTEGSYRNLCAELKAEGFRLKINTVVTSINRNEDMADFIIDVHPERWKVFQVLPVQGQNSRRVDPLVISSEQFNGYVERNIRVQKHGIRLLPEDNEAMTGSYAMVDPAGRFFDAVDPRGYTYSEPILRVGVRKAISQIVISREKFLARGGLYGEEPRKIAAGPLGVR